MQSNAVSTEEARQAAEAIWSWAIESVQAIERGDLVRLGDLSTAIDQANRVLAEAAR